MDAQNTFHTRTTYNLERADYFVVTLVLTTLVVVHATEVNWLRFVIAFAWIDLIGYLPGAIFHRRSQRPTEPISAIFPTLYNATHSIAMNSLVVAVWWATTGQFEWAMLAGPIHLCGDRGIFGNIYKPFALAYEPAEHPLFSRFSTEFSRCR